MGYQCLQASRDATVPNPIFNLTPAATVDEGNNWINIAWGPLAMDETLVPMSRSATRAGSGNVASR